MLIWYLTLSLIVKFFFGLREFINRKQYPYFHRELSFCMRTSWSFRLDPII
jgi:hypothetical protein